MAFTQTGPHEHRTTVQARPGSGQQKFSARVKVAYLADPANATGAFLIARQFYTSWAIAFAGPGSSPGTFKLRGYVANAAGTTVTKDIELGVGAAHEVVLTHDGDLGRQVLYGDGIGSQVGTFTGPLQTSNSLLIVGGAYSTIPSASSWAVDDPCFWDGYTLTIGDILAMRDGADPATIGAGASARYRIPLSLPPGKSFGDAIAVGDAGLRDAYGGGLDIATITGGGTAVYSEPLAWRPAARQGDAYVATSGRQGFFFPQSTATGKEVTPTSIPSPPTITINGTPAGTLANCFASGNARFATFSLPGGRSVSPDDVVRLNAPSGWMMTNAGAAEALVDLQIRVQAGRSCLGTAGKKRRLRVGMNIEYYPTAHTGLNWVVRNLARVMQTSTGVATSDARGKPLTLIGTSATFTLYSNPPSILPNGIDATGYPGYVGLLAIGWDDPNPSSPTTWAINSQNANTTVVTPRTELWNPGVGGVGIVRVYEVTRKPGSNVASTDIGVVVSHAGRAPRFENLMIFEEADFDYQPDTPVVLSMPDPYAVSRRFKANFRNPGSLRMWFNLFGGVNCTMTEPEHSTDLTDFFWGWRASKKILTCSYVEVGPFDTATTPYFYSQVMGDKYAARLTADCDAATTTLFVADAVIVPGQRLFVDDEVMRVDAVSGTTVTVTRGMEDTTPAYHAAKQIQVGYRLATFAPGVGAFDAGIVAKFRTQSNHGLTSGMTVAFSTSGTAYPTLTGTDGRTLVNSQGDTIPLSSATAGPILVTGPDTFLCRVGGGKPCVTTSGTVALDPAAHTTTVRIGSSPQIPYAFAAKIANELDSPYLLLSFPFMATRDLRLKLLRQARDWLEPHRSILSEMHNEVWNTAAGYVQQHLHYWAMTTSLYGPSSPRLLSLVRHTGMLREEGKAVFKEGGRGRSERFGVYLNVYVDTLDGKPLLDWAAVQSPPIPIDAVATAPYITSVLEGSIDVPTANYFNLLAPDQAIDVWVHSLHHTTKSGVGTKYWLATWRKVVDDYAKATGRPCLHVSYEGGIELVYKPNAENFIERNRDLFYHPNYYIAEQDVYALFEEYYDLFNVFCSASSYGSNRNLWGVYHSIQQAAGRGDGSDGKADNRLCLATPGSPFTKSATTNQDLYCVSPRAQAWLDWNRDAAENARRAASRRRDPLPPYRRRAASGG